VIGLWDDDLWSASLVAIHLVIFCLKLLNIVPILDRNDRCIRSSDFSATSSAFLVRASSSAIFCDCKTARMSLTSYVVMLSVASRIALRNSSRFWSSMSLTCLSILLVLSSICLPIDCSI
jgi:hypothetical protein